MKKYLIIVEETETGYSAFSPDLPGCGSTGATKEEVERNIQEALEFHIEGVREEGYEIPEPSSYPAWIPSKPSLTVGLLPRLLSS